MVLSMALLNKIVAGIGFILALATLLSHFMAHPEPPPAPPVMTTQQAYDQICGHPDVCASMHDFIQQVQAEKAGLEITPTPASADSPPAGQVSGGPTSPPANQ